MILVLRVTTKVHNNTCTNGLGGVVTAITTGGQSPLEYSLEGPQTIAYGSIRNFTDLASGSYTVQVRDNHGCVKSASATVSEPAALKVVLKPYQVVFPGNSHGYRVSQVGASDGSFQYTVSGGTPPYTVALSENGDFTATLELATGTFSGLAAAEYTLLVTDSCSRTVSNSSIVVHTPAAPSKPDEVFMNTNMDAGIISISWVPPFDGYNTIQNYTVQLGTIDTTATINWDKAFVLPGVNSSHSIRFTYGRTYYVRLFASNKIGLSPTSNIGQVIAAGI